jgi:hypothetical protein
MMALVGLLANAQYHCTVQSSTAETVTYRATGYGKNVKIASAEAELNAVKALLFTGADGSFKQPLISENKQEAESKYQEALNELYTSAYQDFIESSVTVTAFGKDAEKRKCTTLDVCVRAKQLRAWLENRKVIRKFGF